jgi:hypothetical protein
MNPRLAPARAAFVVAAAACLSSPEALAQVPTRAATVPAEVDAAATETGGFLLAIPGVDDDFVLFADGQWRASGNGTAHWSGYAQRLGAVDRDLFVELTFDGEVAPGAANHPPAGSPIATLDPSAYAPTGPVDPSTWTYFTQVSGTMTGLRAFAGLRVDVVTSGVVQVGIGASNKNVLHGFAADLDLTVVQPPSSAAFAPTGPAELRANFEPQIELCATHVDGDAALSGQTDRIALQLPGIADDYLFLPAGAFVENATGTATLAGTFVRQSDYADRFGAQFVFDQRVDPGDANHPPQGAPTTLLLPGAYVAQGGPIDPAGWRYYQQASAILTGLGANDGASLQLAATGPLQVGLGADQGNGFFGLSGSFAITVSQQPNVGVLQPTGDAELRANLATSCILPAPEVLTGDGQTIENVTGTTLTFTGNDLGFVQQAAIGQNIVGDDDRRWFDGFVRVLDHDTVELSIPQGLPPAQYPLALLNPNRVSNALTLDVVEPLVPTLQTAPDRLATEAQRWIVHRGAGGNALLAFVCISFSNQPSVLPGFVDLQIGNNLIELFVLADTLVDPIQNLAVVTNPTLPALLQGTTLFSQAALAGPTLFPLVSSNVTTTVY